MPEEEQNGNPGGPNGQLPPEILERIPEQFRGAEDPLAAMAKSYNEIRNAYSRGQQQWLQSQQPAAPPERDYEVPRWSQSQGTTGEGRKPLFDNETLQTELFENPAGVLDRVLEVASERAEQNMVQRLTVAEQARQAWESFYGANPDLREHEDLVRGMLTTIAQEPEYQATMGSQPDQHKYVAMRVRQRIASFRDAAARPRANPVSSGATPRPAPRNTEDEFATDDDPKLLAEYLKERLKPFGQ